MTITDTRADRTSIAPIPAWAAAILPAGPALMLAEALTRQSWSIFFGLLSTPFLLVTVVGAAAVCRHSAPRSAAVAMAALLCNVVGLAAVHGAELAAVDLDHATGPAVALLAVLFFGGNLVGGVALIWAQFRTRGLPRLVPALLLASTVTDIALPDGAPALVKAAGMVLFVAWSVALAVSVRRLSPR